MTWHPHPDSVIYQGDATSIGRFRCVVSHPCFRDSGPIREAVVVFPRTSVWIRHQGGRPFVADSNVVTIYNRDQRYERFPIDPSGDHCDWFALAEPLCREVAERVTPARADGRIGPFPFERAPSTAALFSRQRALFLRALRGTLSALEGEEEVLAIVAEVMRLAHAHAGLRDAPRARATRVGRRRRRDLVEDARAALAQSAGENRSVSDIARAIGTSPFHLCRIFREETGQTMHAYRVGLRLCQAIDQFSAPSAARTPTLSEVANAVGFASHAHFVRICQRELGVTPTALRSMVRGGGRRRREAARRTGS